MVFAEKRLLVHKTWSILKQVFDKNRLLVWLRRGGGTGEMPLPLSLHFLAEGRSRSPVHPLSGASRCRLEPLLGARSLYFSNLIS
jgi:hypothetical protein